MMPSECFDRNQLSRAGEFEDKLKELVLVKYQMGTARLPLMALDQGTMIEEVG